MAPIPAPPLDSSTSFFHPLYLLPPLHRSPPFACPRTGTPRSRTKDLSPRPDHPCAPGVVPRLALRNCRRGAACKEHVGDVALRRLQGRCRALGFLLHRWSQQWRVGAYWNFGGILRPVWLEALPAEFIDRAAIDAQGDGQFSAGVYFGGSLTGPARLSGQIENLDGRWKDPFFADLPAGAANAALRAGFQGILTWRAEMPSLYRVRLALALQNGVAHELTPAVRLSHV